MSEMSVRLDEVLERSATTENDGMILCRGCKNRYVLAGDCSDCQLLSRLFNARQESRRAYFSQVELIDMGLAPFDPPEQQAPSSPKVVCAIVAMGLLSVACTLDGAWHLGIGAWHLMKSVIGLLLQVSA